MLTVHQYVLQLIFQTNGAFSYSDILAMTIQQFQQIVLDCAVISGLIQREYMRESARLFSTGEMRWR